MSPLFHVPSSTMATVGGDRLTDIMQRIEASSTTGQLEEIYDQMSEEEKRLARALHKCMSAIRAHIRKIERGK